MDSMEASKEWCAHEKYGIVKATEEDKASHFLELEEGEFRRYEPSVSESLVRKGGDTITKFSSSTQVAVKRQSMSRERGTHRGGTTNTMTEQSDYIIHEDQSVNLWQPTIQRKYSEKRYQSYSRLSHSSSKERRMKRKCNRCRDYKYHRDLEKIEKVCSERISKLVLQQIEDRKKFNVMKKKQQMEFFRELVRSYKFHYEHVIPTVKYERIKLPKLLFGTLSKLFCKHIQSQLRKFVKQQINDRNKEKRIKARWIFEAQAGYLKKYFDETSLTHSEFEMEKSKFHLNDFSDGEEHLEYLNMQSLSSAIEAIAYSNPVADSHTSKNTDVSEPLLENLQLTLKTNGGTKHGLLDDAADEIATIDSTSSLSSAMEFVQKVGTQVTCSQPPQNKGETVGRSCSYVGDMDRTLEIAQAMSVDSSSIEKQTCTSVAAAADASEDSGSRPERNLPHEFVNSFRETTMNDEEPARLASVNVNQREQPSDQTSSLAHVTDQLNISAIERSSLSQHVTHHPVRDNTCQTVTQQHQPSGGSTTMLRTWFDSPGESNIQQQSTNQPISDSTSEHMLESGLRTDLSKMDLSQLSVLRDTMTQRHLAEIQKLNLEREMEMAEIKKKYDDQLHNLEMEKLQKENEAQILYEKVCEQQLLAEAFRAAFSCSRRGAPLTTTITVPDQSPSQYRVLSPIPAAIPSSGHEAVQFSSSATMNQPRSQQTALQLHGQPIMIRQQGTMNTSGRSATILMSGPHGVTGTRIANNSPAPHLGTSHCSLPSPTSPASQLSGHQMARPHTSATTNPPPHMALQLLGQPSITRQESTMNTSGRSATTLTSCPHGVMGTRIAYNSPAPHLRTSCNPLPSPTPATSQPSSQQMVMSSISTNQSSGHRTARSRTLETMNPPPHTALQLLGQPSITRQEGTINTSSRSATTLTSCPRTVMGTRIAHNSPAPHLRTSLNPLSSPTPASSQSSGQQKVLCPTLAANRSSGIGAVQSSVATIMNQPPQTSLQLPSMIRQEGAMNTLGGSATALTRIACNSPAPHLRTSRNRLSSTHRGAKNLEK